MVKNNLAALQYDFKLTTNLIMVENLRLVVGSQDFDRRDRGRIFRHLPGEPGATPEQRHLVVHILNIFTSVSNTAKQKS